MLTVQLSGEFEFSENDLIKRDYEKAIMTDCWMTIKINDETFFDDWVCPLEWYFQYLDWKEEYLKNDIHSFDYVSDDNGDNPILSFKLVDNKWKLCGLLVDKKSSKSFTATELLEFFKSFEDQLLKHKK